MRAPAPLIAPSIALLLVTAAIGCGDESRQIADDEAARALLADVRAADYQSWARMPGYETRQPSRSPHGNAVDIYLNRVLAEAIADGPPWPDGSVVVKDGYDGERAIRRAMMRKSGGEWFFANFTIDDRIVEAGYDAGCVECHDDAHHVLLSAPMAP